MIEAAFSKIGGPFGGEEDFSLLPIGPDVTGLETGCCGSRGGGGVDGFGVVVPPPPPSRGAVVTGGVIVELLVLVPFTELGKGCVRSAPRALLGPETKTPNR